MDSVQGMIHWKEWDSVFLESFILAYMRWTHQNNLTSEVFHSFKSADINEAPRQNDLPLSVISPLSLFLAPYSLFSAPKAHLLVFLLAVAAGVYFLSVHFLQKP